MKNHTLLFFLSILISVSAYAQTGKVYDNLSIESSILDMERKYAIYLPPDYETSERSYPVLYLLHGAGDDHTGWIQFGEVLHITDKAIKEGMSTPMIIVMPDAKTERLGYFNDIKGEWRYEDFFFEEFIPYIEETYRIRSEKRYRAIAGLSMGGGGSFMYTLHHPDMFSSACPLSAATYSGSMFEEFQERYKQDNVDVADSVIQAYGHNHNVVSLIDSTSDDQLKSVRWYIDCGDEDFLYEGNCLVHIALRKREIPHEFRIRDGNHNWTYWRTALPEVLEFVSTAFHQP